MAEFVVLGDEEDADFVEAVDLEDAELPMVEIAVVRLDRASSPPGVRALCVVVDDGDCGFTSEHCESIVDIIAAKGQEVGIAGRSSDVPTV